MKKINVPQCSLQYYLQCLEHGSDLDRCPSTDEWIKKLWYSDKKNAFESVLMKWMDLEPIIQSEGSQKEKDKYHILMQIYGI